MSPASPAGAARKIGSTAVVVRHYGCGHLLQRGDRCCRVHRHRDAHPVGGIGGEVGEDVGWDPSEDIRRDVAFRTARALGGRSPHS